MKAHLPDNMLRLTAITAVVMMALAAIMPFAPAAAAPDQGGDYWTDSFSDSTGISASTNISVSGGDVRLALQNVSSDIFTDSFEVNLDKWNDNGVTAWDLATDLFHDGSRSVKGSNNNEQYVTSDDIDLSDATSATIDFWFNKDDTEGTDFTLYFYDGSNWNLISELDALGGDDVWLQYNHVSIAIPTYGVSNFRIRFDATLGVGENVWVDQLTVNKTVQGYYTTGRLTSVSITPSSLQNWGVFNASHNLPSGTSISYNILDASDDSVLCTITAAEATAGYDISSCAGSTSSIKLRAELSTSNTSETPTISDWKVTWVSPLSIDITAPGDISGWNLDPTLGENTNGGTLAVDVTPFDASWSVTAQDLDTANTNGFMTLWEGSSYNTSVKLATAMNVSGPDGEVTLPSGGAVATGTGDDPAISITFKQFVEWTDDPGTYQIVVTFIATAN